MMSWLCVRCKHDQTKKSEKTSTEQFEIAYYTPLLFMKPFSFLSLQKVNNSSCWHDSNHNNFFMKMSIVLVLVALLFSSTHSFVVCRNEVCSKGFETRSKTELCESVVGDDTITSQPIVRTNKFQSDTYDKPIVLVGCSGMGNELQRLGSSIAAVLNSDTTNAGTDYVVDGTNLNEADIQSLGRSNVIVLDFGKENDKHVMDTLSSLAKFCYEADFLAIYANVHAESSDMSASAADIKEKLEDAVFTKYSDYELCIKDEGLDTDGITSAWEGIEWHAQRLLARAFLPLAIPGSDSNVNSAKLTMGDNTFFLSLSFPDIREADPYMEAMNQDVDAMEFRADLLSCRDDRFELMYSLQKLRDMCRPHAVRAPMLPFLGNVIDDAVPVVYTVRTANQAGTYPDDKAGIERMFDILHLGLRSGVEVLDVESAWDKTKTNHLLNQVEDRYSTQILGSHHVVGKEISDQEAAQLFRKCALEGRAHGAKVVLSIEDKEKDTQAVKSSEEAAKMAQKAGHPIIPHVGLILGEVGQFSRVLNIPFTPVTHESLPFVAAPGQMTANELMTTRLIMGVLQKKNYGILGHNIAYSVSPAMQGAAFAATSLPHSYSLIDMEDVDEFVNSDFWNDDAFGGCSVTIPHKQAIIPHLDKLTDAATAIGAVNTVIVNKDEGESSRVLIGDNTDWRGIYNPLKRKLNSSKSNGEKVGVALILGGGGTARAAAYAANQLGLETIYYNRTPTKAQDLAITFGGDVALTLDDSDEIESLGSILKSKKGRIQVVISTLPAAVEFELPEWLIESAKDDDAVKPIVFDVNYKPYWTKLLSQADNYGFPLVRGSEMLWEQGVGQFELWTGRTAPYKVMKNIVLKNCLPEDEDEAE